MRITDRIKRISSRITAENEDRYIFAIREYYRKFYWNGDSDESFLLWIEGKLNNENEEE